IRESPLKTVTAAGVFCKLVVCLVAVTTTSSSAPAGAAAAVPEEAWAGMSAALGAASAKANAGIATITAINAETRPHLSLDLRMFIPLPLSEFVWAFWPDRCLGLGPDPVGSLFQPLG